ncbi:MAG: hypothetical protein EBZ48_03295 [Proteobacteria bacterium]|nr:hypothetical protein [Pseudomonadota bacterium]
MTTSSKQNLPCAAPPSRNERARWWLVTALLAAAPIIFFWPLLRSYPLPVVPSPYPDALEFIWGTWRIEGVLSGAKQLYFTHDLFAPDGASTLLHTLCEGLLVPVTYLFSWLTPVWRFNGAILIASTLNCFAAVSLLRALGGPALVSGVGALFIAFAPVQLGHLYAGHLNFVVLFPLIEILRGLLVGAGDAQVRAFGRADLGRVSLAALLLPLTNLYYLYFAGLLILAFVARYLSSRGRSWRDMVAFLAAVAAGLGLQLWHLLQIARLAGSKLYTPNHDPLKSSADLLSYLVPSKLQSLGTSASMRELRAGVTVHEGETSLFVGYAVVAAVLLLLWTLRGAARRQVAFLGGVAACACILSAGPVFAFGGAHLFANPLDVALRWLLPLYPSVPARFGVITMIFLVCAVVRGIRASESRRVVAGATLLLFLGVIEIAPVEIELRQLPMESPALVRLNAKDSVRVVVDLPPITQEAMLRQTVHEKPMVGGFLSRRPRKAEREILRNPFVRMLAHPQVDPNPQRLLQGWCALGAGALILETSRVVVLEPQLKALGFQLTDSDSLVTVFEPTAVPCPS